MVKEITYTNRIRIGEQIVCLNDLSEDKKTDIANSLIYRPLLTISNAEVIKTA